jgi:hypothetical protein
VSKVKYSSKKRGLIRSTNLSSPNLLVLLCFLTVREKKDGANLEKLAWVAAVNLQNMETSNSHALMQLREKVVIINSPTLPAVDLVGGRPVWLLQLESLK